MANQIRLKRASGSDPGASDLVLGEPAVRTDTGEIFLKKDDGSIAKVAGGIDDGDKGDITVSNDGGTFTIDSGVIDNANVASNAAIAGSKISPDFGSQDIVTTGGLRLTNTSLTTSGSADELVIGTTSGNRGLTIFSGTSNTGNIFFGDTSTSGTGNRMGTITYDHSGNFMRFSTNGNQERIRINSDGLDVTGNITVSGTVDGRDVASDGSKLDGIESGATADQTAAEIRALVESASDSNVFTDADHSKLNGIAAGATNVTNTNQLTNGAGFITATLTNEQVQDIVGGMVTGNTESGITVTYQDGDGTLDFSVASQTDNNFTNADHSKLDGIEAGATADQTASEILTLIKTVDGSGSGLDADTLDGVSSGSFLRSDAVDTASENITINGLEVGEWSANTSYKGIFHSDQTGSEYMMISNDGHTLISATSGGSVYVRTGNNDSTNQLIVSNGSNGLTWRGNKVFHAGNDGSGSGLDADSVDGIAGSSFLRSDATDSASGALTFTGGLTTNLTSISNGILELKAAIATSHTLTADYNAIAVDPTINNGITVTVPSGAVWAIV